MLSGMGAGAAAGQVQAEALRAAAKQGIVVVATTRTGAGLVVRNDRMKADGWVAGDNLNSYHARILLLLALTKTKDPEQIQRMFDTY